MRVLQNQIIEYLQNCGEYPEQFDTEHVAKVLWRLDYTNLEQVPADDFTRLLIGNVLEGN